MKLIQPKVEILDKIDGQTILERIEQVARTCYKSEPKYIRVNADGTRWVWEDSEEFKILGERGMIEYPTRVSNTADKFVKRLIESKHEAMLEFVDVTVKFTCDRGVSHELVRHRLASYAQESTRYCNYSKDKFGNELTFIIPSWAEINKFGEIVADDDETFYDFKRALEMAEGFYFSLINKGWKPQQARMVLPMSIKTEINMKCNLREWRHFFKLRCSTAAHPDIRKLALDLLNQMHEQIPVIFDDLYEEFLNK